MSTVSTTRTSESPAKALEDALTALERERHTGDAGRAAELAQEALLLDRPDLEARARLIAADAYCRAGDLALAATTLDQLLAWAQAEDEPYVQARAHFLLSILNTCIGDLADARRHALLGVDLLPDSTPAQIRGGHLVVLALTLDTVADKEAGRYHSEALDIAVAAGNHEMIRAVLNNMAFAACQAGDQASAVLLARRMRTLAERTGVMLRPPDLDTLARVALLQGDPAEAERLLLAVTADESVHTEGNMLPELLLTLAEAQRFLNAYDRAGRTLEECLTLCTQRGLGEVGIRARKERARLYAARGDYRSAFEEYVQQDVDAVVLRNAEREKQAQLTQLVFEAREGRRDNERFRDLALRDALTGLYNRRFVDGQLPTLVERTLQDGTPLSVGIVDVDFFKRVNDTLSHEVGDSVLQRIALVLTSVVAEPATVARLGGEEFVIILPASDQADAEAICEQTRLAVREHDWTDLVGDMPISVSIGVASSASGDTSASAMLSRADRNLYAAKRSGRNRVFGDPS